MLGGAPTTHLTEPVLLKMGEHREVLRFIIAAKMTESVILGLSWLDKWRTMIWWEGGYRKLRVGVGPRTPPHERGLRGIESEIRERSGETLEKAFLSPLTMLTWQKYSVRRSPKPYLHTTLLTVGSN